MKNLGSCLVNLSLLALVANLSQSAFGCYWQWEGIKSRFICDPYESRDSGGSGGSGDSDSGSGLALYTENNATIHNHTGNTITFDIKCDGQGSTRIYLESDHKKSYQCSASTADQSAGMSIYFDASFEAGYQQNSYSIGSLVSTNDYEFEVNGNELDLIHW